MDAFPVIKDNYYFECSRCGNCCTGDIQIQLNLYDLYKMSRFMGMDTTRDLFDKNYIRLTGHEHGVRIPAIRFKNRPFKFCPFLINDADENGFNEGLCSLHPDHKPLICAMAPAGRIVDFDNDSEQFVFIKPASDCPGVDSKKENHLSEILDIYNLELNLQKRFFRILDSLRDRELDDSFYLENLYSFNVSADFHEIMVHLENRFVNTPVYG